MTHAWNELFDGVYCINLPSRTERRTTMQRRFDEAGIKVEFVNGIPAVFFKRYLELKNSIDKTEIQNHYHIACALAHCSVYSLALARGKKKILVLEDDTRIHINSDANTRTFMQDVPSNWDILYFGYIPLSECMTYWNYALIDPHVLQKGVAKASNLWTMMAYAINENMMNHMINVYASEMPMAIDNYYVHIIQKSNEFNSYAVMPQIVATQDGSSDTEGGTENGLKSVDARYAYYIDYKA
jgi:GR25 family glycosyltransferase involved in LPS biosynthesis